MYVFQANAPKVQYDYFDFHKECKNMRWNRIELLLERIKDDLTEKGYVADETTGVSISHDLPTHIGTSMMMHQPRHLDDFRLELFAPIAWII